MIETAAKILPKTINIFRLYPKENFRMVPEWLSKAMCYGTKEARAIDYARLNFMLSWHPNESVSPEALKKHAAQDGKKISNGSAYDTFKNLEKAGHVKKKKQSKDKRGKFLKPNYQVWEEPFGWKNLETDSKNMETDDNNEIQNNNSDVEEILNEITDSKNMETAYNKERAGLDYMSLQEEQQQPKSVVVPLFDPRIESKLKDRPDIDRQWIAESLKLPKQSIENILIAIDKSNSADTPTAWLRAALRDCYEFEAPKEIEDHKEKYIEETKESEKLGFKLLKIKDENKIKQQADKLESIIENLNDEQKEKAYNYLLFQSPMKKRIKLRKLNIDDALRLQSVKFKLQKYFKLEFE